MSRVYPFMAHDFFFTFALHMLHVLSDEAYLWQCDAQGRAMAAARPRTRHRIRPLTHGLLDIQHIC